MGGAEAPPTGHRAGQPAEAVEPGTGRQVFPAVGHPGTRTFNDTIRAGNLNPFQQDAVIICSYHFARKMEPYIRQTAGIWWSSTKPTGSATCTSPRTRLPTPSSKPWPRSARCCLTATPLQNSLLELYGLVSIIDDFAFGDLKTYRARFTRLSDNDDDFNDLKERLRPICKRTLRKQVLEYIKYTTAMPSCRSSFPRRGEQRLYDLVSEYLQQPTLYALPASQRPLMTLILRKLLASSTYAISDTLRAWPQARNGRRSRRKRWMLRPSDMAENLRS